MTLTITPYTISSVPIWNTGTEDYLLPVVGGKCINLENGQLIERTKDHYFSFEIDVNYNPEGETTEADNFFNSIMCNDKDIVKYLKKVIGSFLVSQTEAQSIYIFWGNGSNGKSACMNLISKVLGKFNATLDKGIFMDNKNKNSLFESIAIKDVSSIA